MSYVEETGIITELKCRNTVLKETVRLSCVVRLCKIKDIPNAYVLEK